MPLGGVANQAEGFFAIRLANRLQPGVVVKGGYPQVGQSCRIVLQINWLIFVHELAVRIVTRTSDGENSPSTHIRVAVISF